MVYTRLIDVEGVRSYEFLYWLTGYGMRKEEGSQGWLQDLGAEQLEKMELTFTKIWMTETVLGERSETQSWIS